jgi:hypothetical protein
MKEKLPNFLIVGAAKAGTTSLYHYLQEHPDIYLYDKKKELRFFSQMRGNFCGPGDENVNVSITRGIKDYIKYFKCIKSEKAIGDISPEYLYFYKDSIYNIKKYLNSPKIIIILRNPIDRGFSHWGHFVRDGREKLSFEEALNQEENRKQNNWEWAWYYKSVGLYYNQVKAYLENFDNVKVYLYDDLKNNSLRLVQDIYRFLEVDDSFVPSSLGEKYNVSGVPKNKLLHKFLRGNNIIKTILKPVVQVALPNKKQRQKLINRIIQKNLQKPQMKLETREYLKNYFKEDILKLQDLINRDFSNSR